MRVCYPCLMQQQHPEALSQARVEGMCQALSQQTLAGAAAGPTSSKYSASCTLLQGCPWAPSHCWPTPPCFTLDLAFHFDADEKMLFKKSCSVFLFLLTFFPIFTFFPLPFINLRGVLSWLLEQILLQAEG